MSTRRRTQTATATQLGDLTFDDWYETPVFEEEPDERLEQLATSKRAPLRLIGSAMLRLAPDQPAGPPAPAGTAEPGDGSETGSGEDGMDPDFEAYCAMVPEGSWRQRAGRLLDRWADAEIASQARLEEIVLPKRWRR